MSGGTPQRPEPPDFERTFGVFLKQIQERFGWTRHQALVTVAASLAIVATCCLTGSLAILATPNSPDPTAIRAIPTLGVLPTLTLDDAIARINIANVPLTNVTPLSVPDTTWSALQGVRFTAAGSTYLLLIYPSIEQATSDLAKAMRSDTYRKWGKSRSGNVLLLGSVSATSQPPSTMSAFATLNAPLMGWMLNPASTLPITPLSETPTRQASATRRP